MATIKIINSRQGVANILLTLDASASTKNTGIFHRFGKWFMDDKDPYNEIPLNITINTPTDEAYEYKIYRKSNETDNIEREIYSEIISNVVTFNKVYWDTGSEHISGEITYRVELFKQGSLVIKSPELKVITLSGGGGWYSDDSSGSSPGN